jgi:hypothetical protein
MISIEGMTSVLSGGANPIMISRLIFPHSVITLKLRSSEEEDQAHGPEESRETKKSEDQLETKGVLQQTRIVPKIRT